MLPLLRRFEALRNTVAHSRPVLPFEADLLSGIAGEIAASRARPADRRRRQLPPRTGDCGEGGEAPDLTRAIAARLALRARLRDDSALGRTDAHQRGGQRVRQWGVLMAVAGEKPMAVDKTIGVQSSFVFRRSASVYARACQGDCCRNEGCQCGENSDLQACDTHSIPFLEIWNLNHIPPTKPGSSAGSHHCYATHRWMRWFLRAASLSGNP